MPPIRLALLLACTVIAAGLTIWLGATLAGAAAIPLAWLAPIPVGLSALLLWRGTARLKTTRPDDAR